MTGRVWLVRHASTEWTGRRWLGRRDLPLSPGGRAEAETLAASLAPRLSAGAAVVASPARRAVETAAPLAARLGIAVDCDADLREIDVGRAEGMTWEDVQGTMPELAAALAEGKLFDWPGGETWAELSERVGRAWRRLEVTARPVVVVTHAGVIARLVADLVPAAPATWLRPAGVVALRMTAAEGGDAAVEDAGAAWEIDGTAEWQA